MLNRQILISDLYDAVQDGLYSWEHIAVCALKYMQEGDIHDMLEVNEIFIKEVVEDEY